MADPRSAPAARRSGAETRAAAQRVALDLFTAQGYEATSLRQIADALGINKASLYYHFASKEEIVRSLFDARGSEVEELLAWVRAQESSPDLLTRAVLRWVDSFSAGKLQGIRFLRANPLLARTLGGGGGERIGSGLAQLADTLAGLLPSPTGADLLVLRMALLSINAAVEASIDTNLPDEQVLAAAHTAAGALVDRLLRG